MPIFEGTQLFLINEHCYKYSHLHEPILFTGLIQDRWPCNVDDLPRIDQRLSKFRFFTGGFWWEWVTIKEEDRCVCGFMPYSAPRKIE